MAETESSAGTGYWRNILSGNPLKTAFLYDYRLRKRRRRLLETAEIPLHPGFCARIRRRGGGGQTMLAFLTAALNTLIHRYTAETDILIDLPPFRSGSKQKKKEPSPTPSYFPLRCRLDPEIPFITLFEQMQQTLEQIKQHAGEPFSDDSSREIMLSLEGYHRELQPRESDFNIHFHFKCSDGNLSGRVEYNALLYYKNTIADIVGHFMRILAEAAADPHQPLAAVRLLSEEEMSHLLADFNATDRDYPHHKTISQVFQDRVRQAPDDIALLDGAWKLTFRDLNRRASQLAFRLRHEGVRVNSIVAHIIPRSCDMVAAQLATLKAGGAYLSIDLNQPAARWEFILRDSAAAFLLTTEHWRREKHNTLSGIFQGKIIPVDDPNLTTDPAAGEDTRCPAKPDDVAYVIYTSGSTGKPKGVLLQHRGVTSLAQAFGEIFQITPHDRVIQFAAATFDASVSEVYMALLNGAALCLAGSDIIGDYQRFTQYINYHRVTIATLPPIYAHHLDPDKISHLRVLITAGSAPGDRLVDRWRKRLQYVNAYGPTEATVCSTLWLAPQQASELESITIGPPINNTKIYILDSRLNPVPIGAPGELCISGLPLARGYLNQPELTAEKFIHTPPHLKTILPPVLYKTGDLARWRPDGHVEFLGRSDFQLKIRGFRVEPGEIENHMEKFPGLTDAAVIPCRDHSGETCLCAFHCAERNISATELRAFLTRLLPEYMIPAHFLQLPAIPLNSSGKVDVSALPETLGVSFTDAGFVPAETELHRHLIAIWAPVLHLPENCIGIDTSFFDLGGHSLKAAIVIAAISKHLRIKILLSQFFRENTVRKLAALIEASEIQHYEHIYSGEKKEYFPLSSAQKRLYILFQMDPNNTGYNIQLLDAGTGKLEKDRVEIAFRQLIQRHESLRTSFELLNGKPVQRIHDYVPFEVEYYHSVEGRRRVSARPGEGKTAHQIVSRFVRPFDLGKVPLLRVGLIDVRGLRRILALDMHHIISDGISMGIIVKEFRALYEGKALPPLRLQYRDFCEWQNTRRRKEDRKRQESFWLNIFTGEIPVLQLPADFPRPAQRTFDGQTLYFTLPRHLTSQLKSLAQSRNVTLYMTLLAAYNILLSRLTGQEDIVVGTVTAGRPHEDLYRIIGMFANTLALRNAPVGDKPFSTFLEEVKQTTINAFENQDYPFESLVSRVAKRKDTGRNPLFDVSFGLENQAEQSEDILEVVIPGKPKPYDFDIHRAKFDITLIGVDIDEGMQFFLEYNTRLFRETTILRWFGYYKEILASAVCHPDWPLYRQNLLPTEELKQILYSFNQTGVEYRRDETIHGMFLRRAEFQPGAAALCGASCLPALSPSEAANPDGFAIDFPEITLTYGELDILSGRLARRLLEKGVNRGDIVALILPRSLENCAATLAILRCGGIFLPVDPAYPRERIRYILTDSAAAFVITVGTVSEQIFPDAWPIESEHAVTEIRLDQEFAVGVPAAPVFTCPDITPDDCAYIIYTSGTTGGPKGVVLRHRGIPNLNNLFRRDFRLAPGDNILQFASYAFDASIWETFMALLNGAALFTPHPGIINDYLRFEKYIQRHGITVLTLPPVYANLLTPEHVAPPLRLLITAGSAPGSDLVNKWKNHLTYINAYGPTEATICASYWRAGAGARAGSTPIGGPVPNYRIFILDRYLQVTPPGTPGELCIAGAGLAVGYINRPALTAEKFVILPPAHEAAYSASVSASPGTLGADSDSRRIYRTGDLACWLPDGNIEFLGRIDRQVKIRGFRIELAEIEAQLRRLPNLRDAVVADRSDYKGETFLCAWVSSKQRINPDELRSALLKFLPDYMIPHYFVEIDEIPLTSSGKVDHKSLPEPDVVPANRDYQAPRNARQRLLTEIWENILGLRRIGVSDDFFQHGGDSIKAIEIVSALKKKDWYMDIKDLFLHRTIEKVWKCMIPLSSMSRGGDEPVEGPVTLTPIIHWFFNQPFSHRNHFSQYIILNYPERCTVELLERVCSKLAERHDALRMVFPSADGRVAPVIRGIRDKQRLFIVEATHWKPGQDIQTMLHRESRRLHAGIDIQRGPLFKAILVQDRDMDYIIFSAHHLVVDGVSWRIIAEDFIELCRLAGEQCDLLLPPKSLSFKDWAGFMRDYASEYRLLRQIPFWREITETPVPPLPRNEGNFHRFFGELETRTVFLEAQETASLLKEVHQPFNTEINDLLLTALGRVISAWTNSEYVRVSLEGHGRETSVKQVDLSRTVGWFTSQFPVLLTIRRDQDASRHLRCVKETLRRIPDKGVGYGALCSLTPERMLSHRLPTETAEINFNYLGRFDPRITLGAAISPSFKKPTPLDIEISIEHDRLKISFIYHPRELDPIVMEKLARDYRDELLTLIAVCLLSQRRVMTPSDLGCAGLSLEAFDALLTRLRERIGCNNRILSIFPLSPMQAFMFSDTLINPQAYFVQNLFSLPAAVRPDLLEKSFQILIQTYDILRTIFVEPFSDSPRPLQCGLEHNAIPLEISDVSHLSDNERREKVERYMEEDKSRGFDLTRRPLMRLMLFTADCGKKYLVWSVHHIIMDGWCFGIIVQNWIKIYKNLSRRPADKDIEPAPAAPFRAYVEWLWNQDISEGLAYWDFYLSGFRPSQGLCALGKPEQNGLYISREFHTELDPALTERLHRSASRFRVTLNTLFQLMWGLQLQKILRSPDVMFGAVVSGRSVEVEAIDSMVGLLINIIPIRLKSEGAESDTVWLNQLQQQAGVAKYFESIPLENILAAAGLPFSAMDSLLFFENYPMTGFQEKTCDCSTPEEFVWLDNREQFGFPLNIYILPGKRIKIRFNYNSAVFEPELIRMLAEGIREQAERLSYSLPESAEILHD